MHAVAVLSAAATAQLSYFPSQVSQDLHMQIVSFAHTIKTVCLQLRLQ